MYFKLQQLFMRLYRNFFTYFLICTCQFIFSCNRSPYTSTNKLYKKQSKLLARQIRQAPLKDSFVTGEWIGTINFNLRKPNFVIIHHMLNDYLRAWQAGISKWGNNTDINSSSIGIEIDNNGLDSFTDQQIASLLTILASLKKAYSIPTANFIGHQDIAPGRKVDPNVYFPWKKLADSGFGIWWSDTTNIMVPPDFNSLQALRIIGYDIKDSVAVIQTFKRKYEQIEDKSDMLNDADKKILYTLYRKF